MVIGGRKIKKGQKIKELDEYYFQAIKSIARESLSELKFVTIVTHKCSKSTDSIYFKFKVNHHESVYTLSLRTHRPKEYEDHYFYVYLYDYDTLAEVKTAIQGQLIAHYNKKANKLGIVKQLKDYAKPPHSYHTTKKRKNKNQKKVCSLCFNEPFHQLMHEVNNRNQLGKPIIEINCTQGHFKRCRGNKK